jgi:hypothetical protein
MLFATAEAFRWTTTQYHRLFCFPTSSRSPRRDLRSTACQFRGGAVLLPAADRQYGLIDSLTSCLVDDRQPTKIRHTLRDLLAQRILGSPAGTPMRMTRTDWPTIPFTSAGGPRPGRRGSVGSQPTISQFENGMGIQDLFALGCTLATQVIDRHRRRLRRRARRITIDLEPTDPTHGAQQLTFFNGHYDTWCYLPLLAFLDL